MGSKELKISSERIGQLYPILVDYYGNIIDGQHRLEANKNWQKISLSHIKTEKDRLLARIVSNIVRRKVSRREKRKLLDKLGEILLREGVEPGKIAPKIAEETGMSYRWVMKYLPNRFKDRLQSERASSAAHYAAGVLTELLRPPKRRGSLMIKNYTNTDFVCLTLEKKFFEEFQRNSLKLEVSPEVSVLKALEEYNEKMRRGIELKTKSKPLLAAF